MGVALFLIGGLFLLAGVIMFVIALVRKRGWGIAGALAIGVVGLILVIVGTVVGIGEATKEEETVTPSTTVIPTTPETEVVKELGKSRLNPVPVGSALTYGDQRVTVLSSERVHKIGWYTASASKVYLIVKLKVDFLGDASRTHRLHKSDFDVAGDSGYIYEYEWIDTDTPVKTGDLYGGASTSGDVIYEIEQSETNMVLIWHIGWTVERYLQIP